ncbi:MAG: DNA polymerase III subunit delta [Planctomycetes bacterium]|nr:DNA polymerase III subunit delta [Planctomycetota bacterium]
MPETTNDTCYIYALVGADRFMRREALLPLLKQLDDGSGLFDPVRFDGSDAVLADVLDDVRTATLLGGLRVVVVDNADPFITANRASLERYSSDPSNTGCLILLCNTLPRNTRLFKIIQSGGRIVPCEAPKAGAVAGWVVERARTAHGKRIAVTAARHLQDQLGNDPGILDTELAKLCAYAGDRPEILAEDIQALTGHHREENVFAVMDALSEGNTRSALGYWQQVLDTDRAAPGRAIAGLAWAVRRLIQVRHDWQEGANLGGLARSMYTNPDTLRRRLENASIDDLESRQRDLLEADLAVKTGASTVESAIETFIVKHSTKRGAQGARQ